MKIVLSIDALDVNLTDEQYSAIVNLQYYLDWFNRCSVRDRAIGDSSNAHPPCFSLAVSGRVVTLHVSAAAEGGSRGRFPPTLSPNPALPCRPDGDGRLPAADGRLLIFGGFDGAGFLGDLTAAVLDPSGK